MGIAAGGKITQKVYKDTKNISRFNITNCTKMHVQILNTTQWTLITGNPAPKPVISFETYNKYDYPWFKLFDDDQKAINEG